MDLYLRTGAYKMGGALFLNFTVLPVRQGSPRIKTVLITCSETQRSLRSFPEEPEIKQRWILEHVLKNISCDITFFA